VNPRKREGSEKARPLDFARVFWKTRDFRPAEIPRTNRDLENGFDDEYSVFLERDAVISEGRRSIERGRKSLLKWNEVVPAPISLGRFRLCARAWRQRKERVGHVELDSDGPDPGIPHVYSLALVLAHSDDPGPGTLRVYSLALVAAAMGRFKVVLAAANSRAGLLFATHRRVA
jgi:hypothetical protein